ncbi:MAG: 2-oxoacid:acceptor oxidoreductase family protein [Bacteroidota bacterium]
MNQEIEILNESSTTLRSTTRLVEVDRPVGSHRPTKSEEDLLEIRWHGRGGQGVKTAAMLFAETAIEEGKYAQGSPEYGPERMGAPTKGYTRISSQTILSHSSITEPDVVIVLDPTLLENPEIVEGIPDNGILIVNTSKSPGEIRKELNLVGRRIFTVNGTQLALDTLGKAIPNTVMLGALIRVSKVFDLATMEKNIVKKFEKKYNEQVADMNIRAIRRAYEEVQGE